jgi:3-dehydroquinate synthase
MLTIQSKSHPYRVVEASSAHAAVAEIENGRDAFYLLDCRVAELYESQFEDVIPAGQRFEVEATERAKSYDQLEPIFCWLLESRVRRSSHLVVIGGGVVQDIGCFIASVLMRGIRWTLVPTTLLAQCDSCIGSKSSLNINRYKNQLGTFYPPHEVQLSVDFLRTLTIEEIYSGLGEAIKLHLIDGQRSTDLLQREMAQAELSQLPLRDIIWRSLAIKKRFIEEDEFDRGIRNILNYGHTFAHALESATQYAIPHGIAVTIGIVFATYFAMRKEMASSDYFDMVLEWTRPFFAKYVTRIKEVNLQAVADAMKQDKKNTGSEVTFILSREPGIMEKVAMNAQAVPALMEDCRKRL